MPRLLCALVLVVLTLPLSRLSAQLANPDAPIVVSHYHLNVTSVDAHKKFWVDTLGGTAMKIGDADVVRFPGVFLFLRPQKPTGPTYGTTFDHIGFAAPSVPALAAKVVAAGYQQTFGRETAAGPVPTPGQPTGAGPGGQPAGSGGTSAVYGRFAYLLGPDGVKVELVTGEPTAPPIAHHHVHFINRQYIEMNQWYMKALNSTLRAGQTDFFVGSDLPGVGYMLNFFHWELPRELVGTRGRAVDHVGFEVKGLEAFCKTLEAKGITLTQPYRKTGDIRNVATAVITDPWGTVIELTEGLNAVK